MPTAMRPGRRRSPVRSHRVGEEVLRDLRHGCRRRRRSCRRHRPRRGARPPSARRCRPRTTSRRGLPSRRRPGRRRRRHARGGSIGLPRRVRRLVAAELCDEGSRRSRARPSVGHSAATASVGAAPSPSTIQHAIWSAASRPSRIAQTTSEAPRTMSPPAKTPGSVGHHGAVVHLQRAPLRHRQRRFVEHRGQVLGVEAQRLDRPGRRDGEAAAGDRSPPAAGRSRRAGRDASAPRARRSTRVARRGRPRAPASQANSTPSSSAFFTSRIEPGMFALSRR